MNPFKVAIASDHAGFKLKQKIINHLQSKNFTVYDFGTHSEQSVDYPDYAHPLAKSIQNNEYEFGIAICGSGNGISMTVNKYPKIRAALCWTTEIAKLARMHNNANICSLPARFINDETAIQIIDTFLTTSFEGGRHEARIKKIPLC